VSTAEAKWKSSSILVAKLKSTDEVVGAGLGKFPTATKKIGALLT
jgi:hypothetical protein